MKQDRPPETLIPKPPEGWRERVESEDEMIGYITRRLERDYDTQLSYQTVWNVLKLEREYQSRRC